MSQWSLVGLENAVFVSAVSERCVDGEYLNKIVRPCSTTTCKFISNCAEKNYITGQVLMYFREQNI